MNQDTATSQRRKTRKLALILAGVVIVMFGFGYALVPLYSVICEALGINGKTGGQTAATAVSAVDQSRTITVQFIATNNAHLPWAFYPAEKTVKIHPGANTLIHYIAKNESGRIMTVQAVPSVAPASAAKYLRKTECFCFAQQTLKNGESMDMPLLFHLDRDLPKNIGTITLAYTLFDAKGNKTRVSAKKQGRIS